MKRLLPLLLLLLTAGCAGPSPSAISIAVVPFALMPGSPPPPIDVAEAIASDLAANGRFSPVDVAAMPAQPSDVADVRFGDWRELGVDYLVVGRVAMVHDGGHEVEYQVVDARTERTSFGFQVQSAPDQLAMTAREIAGFVGQRIEG